MPADWGHCLTRHCTWSAQLAALELVLFVILAYSSSPTASLFAREVAHAQEASLVTLELRYSMLEAGEVFLVWGVSGWSVVPETIRPEGTFVDQVMHTPMIREDETFVAKVRVPIGVTLDYGFRVRTRHDGSAIQWVWDGDHQMSVSKDDRLEIKPAIPPARPVETAEPPLTTQEIRYRMPDAREVVLVWGIDGWSVIPKARRPPGTAVDSRRRMNTPMHREEDAFVIKVQIPVGSLLNYGFQITPDTSGGPIKIWDGDYSLRPTEHGLIETTSTLWLLRATNLFEAMVVPLTYLAGLILVWGCWFLVRLSVHLPLWARHAVLIVLVNVSLLSFFFVIGETYLRWKEFEPYVRTYPGQYQDKPLTEGRWRSDQFLGWVGGVRNTDINGQGFRDQKDFERVDLNTNKTRVMVLGDSFLWGSSVSSGESVPGLLQSWTSDTHLVFNLGVPGWGIDQMYLAYQRYKDKLSPHIVIVAFIDDNIVRVLESYRKWEGMSKPSFTIHEGRLRPQSVPSRMQLWFDDTMGRSLLFGTLMREIYLMFDAGPIVRHLLQDLVRDTQERNARLAILRVPTKDPSSGRFSVQYHLSKLEDNLRGTGALYLDPAEEMSRFPDWSSKFYLNDIGGHLSIEGNQYLARYVQNHILYDQQNAASVKAIND